MTQNNQLESMKLEQMQLNEVIKHCEKLILLKDKEVSNNDLFSLLSEKYKLIEEDIEKINQIIKGKKKTNDKDKKEAENTKIRLLAYCTIVGIEKNDTEDYSLLINEVTPKINKLKKDINKLSKKQPK